MNKMNKFIAVKYKLLDNGEMDRFEQIEYTGDNIEEVAKSLLYYLRLKNRKAEIGPSKQVLYDGFGYCWCITPVKMDLNGNNLIYKDGLWYKSPVDELPKTE